jgi:hypothetical protein
MIELEILQDLFNTLGLHGSLRGPVNVLEFVAGAHGLRDLGPNSYTDPRHIMQCIAKMAGGVGPVYFQQLIDTPADVDDMWVHYWCPQPPGSELHKASCPAGTTPLWTNGTSTVFARRMKDQHGNDAFAFAVHREPAG